MDGKADSLSVEVANARDGNVFHCHVAIFSLPSSLPLALDLALKCRSWLTLSLAQIRVVAILYGTLSIYTMPARRFDRNLGLLTLFPVISVTPNPL